MTVLSSSSICKDSVYNNAGDKLGDIKDLMIDCNTGKVNYAVLEFGGLFGIGSKLFAVPLNVMRVNTENKRFIFDITKDRLDNAPGFDKDHWPDFADTSFQQSVNDYYGSFRP